MVHDIKTAFKRSRSTLAQDFLGAASLLVILVGGLYVPGML
ncbi:hypothetical protein AQS8620_01509 [Aquimixticola soesokkakensis]|uniref:Uncharacterized protein n=1 Tax=Aquimixticola soesokkakensis TaxID=1519096 RepID=A0A1Y5SH71_9RHOB|nr:hypothetical protein AQS8620_01509 [Aquimixticola soesokkakensis]